MLVSMPLMDAQGKEIKMYIVQQNDIATFYYDEFYDVRWKDSNKDDIHYEFIAPFKDCPEYGEIDVKKLYLTTLSPMPVQPPRENGFITVKLLKKS